MARYRAELSIIAKRPASWVIAAMWLALLLLFTYLFPYLRYRDAAKAAARASFLASLLPGNLAGHTLIGIPIWGGALIVALAALLMGSEYGFGTLKTIYSTDPSRLRAYGAKLLAVWTATVALFLVSDLVMGALSVLIAHSANASAAFPSASDMSRSVLAGCLLFGLWAAFGMMLAIAVRGTALAISIGLIWVLALENLVRAVAPDFALMADIEKILPGVNAGALVSSFSPVIGGSAGSVGVSAVVSTTHALIVVVVELLVFIAVGGVLLVRRDVA